VSFDRRPSRRRVLRRIALLACAAPLALACGPAPAPRERPLAFVSVAPVRWFVERLAGDWLDVQVMLPPGAGHVAYEPDMGQLRALAEASLYVEVGQPGIVFERAQLPALLEENPDLQLLNASEDIAARSGDPHVWLAPEPARHMLRAIARALAERFPDHAASVHEKLSVALAEVDAVDSEVAAALAARRGWRFFVFHPAWGYFAEAYGLSQVAVEHERKSPDARRVAALVKEAREASVRAIFVQPQMDTHPARVVADEIGATLVVLDPMAEDWPANLRRAGRLVAEYAVP